MNGVTTTPSRAELISSTGDAAAIIDVATRAADPTTVHAPDGEPVSLSIIVPEGARHLQVPLEQFQAHPNRARGTVTHDTVDSLADYVARHETNATTVWVGRDGEIVAVLDDHDAEGLPHWGQHRATHRLQFTPEWEMWTAQDGDLLNQVAFAQLMEDGAREIIEPTAAAMIEIASNFHATPTAMYRSAIRLDDGTVRMQLDEETKAKVGRDEADVPAQFVLAIAPYVGEPPYMLTARLRWRLVGGVLTLGYKLDRPHLVLDDALWAPARDAIVEDGEIVRDAQPGGIATRLRDRFQRTYLGKPRAATV